MIIPKHHPVGWFEIYVQDLARAKAFYENVFQVALEKLPNPDPDLQMWVFPGMGQMDRPGCNGALCQMKNKNPGAGGTLIYFLCEDCAVEASRAASHGGRVHMEKMSIGQYGHIALIYDTEGNLIGLHSMK
jgi:predicted enzyme related to lactoylglutathione lyase